MRKHLVITLTMAMCAVVVTFVALATVTPVAFAALGCLPIVQYRLMATIED